MGVGEPRTHRRTYGWHVLQSAIWGPSRNQMITKPDHPQARVGGHEAGEGPHPGSVARVTEHEGLRTVLASILTYVWVLAFLQVAAPAAAGGALGQEHPERLLVPTCRLQASGRPCPAWDRLWRCYPYECTLVWDDETGEVDEQTEQRHPVMHGTLLWLGSIGGARTW
jgi:hypothetical protein